ncbi:uncharacterized protein A4U43_C10F16190 [Asparagus officinalis]|uniref:Peptidase A2 domain-containing protein n=1 Tax=Asparagus officinalis TaxID=4686 RepID=A0A5P1E3L1_ASPOF|nr:uncharacterized protein A4U43_C10F16190 [Asparagus officinalis]
MYNLLRLSRSTREALQEALADSEAFYTHFSKEAEAEQGCAICCQVSIRRVPCITFTPEDMIIKSTSHDRPLYFTGYVGSSKVDRIQVDPGSALSIVPLKLIKHLGIPPKSLSLTATTIFGFNATGTRPRGKIRLKCRIGDMKTKVTCYVIDAEPSYNILLGRPWIHGNRIVPSTLHQCLKYVDDYERVRTVVADKQPFKGVENYFTDSLLYQDPNAPPAEEPESGNEADS